MSKVPQKEPSIRRSARVKKRRDLIETLEKSEVLSHAPSVSTQSNTSTILRRRAEIENAIKKQKSEQERVEKDRLLKQKKLEQDFERELENSRQDQIRRDVLLDMELQLQLTEISETCSRGKSLDSISYYSQRSNVDKWIDSTTHELPLEISLGNEDNEQSEKHLLEIKSAPYNYNPPILLQHNTIFQSNNYQSDNQIHANSNPYVDNLQTDNNIQLENYIEKNTEKNDKYNSIITADSHIDKLIRQADSHKDKLIRQADSLKDKFVSEDIHQEKNAKAEKKERYNQFNSNRDIYKFNRDGQTKTNHNENFRSSYGSENVNIIKMLTRQSMPKELPEFSGDPIQWPSFRAHYINSTRICSFTDEENQCRLQKSLKGNARKIVDSLLMLPQNINKVIEKLEKRFGQPEHIIFLLLEKIRHFPMVRDERLDILIEFSDEVTNFVASIQALNEQDHLRNPILLNELVNKLSTNYKMMWSEYSLSLINTKPKLEEFQIWLEIKSTAACKLQVPKFEDKNDPKKTGNVTLTTTVKENYHKFKSICTFCESESHQISSCPKFIEESPNERWGFITKNRMCFSCLISNHSIKECKKKKQCNIEGCKRAHHYLLHYKQEPSINNESLPSTNNNSQSSTSSPVLNCHIVGNEEDKVILKILPIIVKGTVIFKTYALLDEASTISIIDNDLAKLLNLEGPQKSLIMQWTGEEIREEHDSRIVSLTISGDYENAKTFQLRHLRTSKNLSLPVQNIDLEALAKKYPHIDLQKITNQTGKPLILIGQDNWPLIVSRKLVSGPWRGPAMSKTILGWVLHGNVSSTMTSPASYQQVYNINYREKDDLDILHDLVKLQWKMDCSGYSPNKISMSKQDKRAQEILDNTVKRIDDGFEVGLLWKSDDIRLPNSRFQALTRLKSTERKMEKDPEYFKDYCDKILDLQHKGYVKKVDDTEDLENPGKLWYLPHFGVSNPNKKKLRIVFDASSRSQEMSLNDQLLTGPDLFNNLTTIILNFRIKKVAFVADIKEMFLQVKVRKEDRCAQRFLWRNGEKNKYPEVYEFQVVFFGSTCGPCVAQEVKNRNAKEFETLYPEASTAIIRKHYMDDYLDCSDNDENAIKLIKEVIFIHKQGGFTLCNWISNSKTVLSSIDKELTASGEKIVKINDSLSESSPERILGLWWYPDLDKFGFQLNLHKVDPKVISNSRRPTKREVLKTVMAIFDPLGLVANFLIQGKILLQDIWRRDISWDDEITDELYEKWQTWFQELKNIKTFSLPRQYTTLDRNKSHIELHIFNDASELAYASVAYLRWECDNKIEVSFVMAKTRVAPLKPMSIPRLELQAAVMGSRLASFIKESLEVNIKETFYWSDSKTVLYWIKSEARRFQTFVAQRLGEIQELTGVSQWNYISSKENVADDATKRKRETDFSEDSRWIKGPKFLLEPKKMWPNENIDLNNIESIEEKINYVFITVLAPVIMIPDPERFSKWTRILRTTAWIYRFIEKCRKDVKKDQVNYNALQPSELNLAELILIKQAQSASFPKEYELFEKNKSLPPSSRIYKLNCYKDKDGLIRLNGRLSCATNIPELTKNPLLLDPKHRITKLIINNYHERSQHQGNETILNMIRQKYWIINSRQAIKDAAFNCQKCKNKNSTPSVPKMGQLPSCRLERTIRPFIKTGVDYFGPMLVTVKRSAEKRYGVIFTCMATRAIHLEIANDLTTNAFIHVFRQFGCRRGFPDELYSDNGSNFRNAEKELKLSLKELNQEEIAEFCAIKGTKWYFNPPLAPHMGGSWERLIQIVKKVLKSLLTTRRPKEFVLKTFFAEAENIVNSRPLTHISLDSKDDGALTPNHFLIGEQYSAEPFCVTDESDLTLLNKWKAAQRLSDMFWSRWTKEYLPTLIKGNKWFEDRQAIQLGNIVVIVDPDGPRNQWPMGEVVRLYPSTDGRIRVVDVRTKLGIRKRAVAKLCVLDIKKN